MGSMAEEPKDSSQLELAPAAQMASEPLETGFWSKLQRGLRRTHGELLDRMGAGIRGPVTLDDSTLDFLEEVLISADLGVDTTVELLARVKRNATREQAGDEARLRKLLADETAGMLEESAPRHRQGSGPTLTLVVGVNGVGKTTSIAKLALRQRLAGRTVLLVAADTFRAAAVEQLALWGQRLEIDVIRQGAGADPAAVVYDGIHAAQARGIQDVIIDTAGRLHTKDHLMAELGKVRRVVDREAPDRQRRTLLVLDATTGQNAIAQARTFSQVVPVDGVLLAKLDGTAKGGMVVAIARELHLPVLYLGVGEQPEDLVEFRPREFAAALLG
jgi:fused signal recognition particle receptor